MLKLASLVQVLDSTLYLIDPAQTVDFGDGPQPVRLHLDARNVENALLCPLPTGEALFTPFWDHPDAKTFYIPASLVDAVRRVLNLQAVTA